MMQICEGKKLTADQPQYKKYQIGRYTYGTPSILTWGEQATLKIGSFCSISGDVKIFLVADHRPDWVTTYPFNAIAKDFAHIQGHPTTKGDVVIGNDVWICNGATILSGVTIGDGSVIGASAVVTGSVEPYSIVAGNPARLIRKRFDPATITQLLKIKWWDWDINVIEENVPLMLSTQIEKFIQKCEEMGCL